jgi:hypothetical protein
MDRGWIGAGLATGLMLLATGSLLAQGRQQDSNLSAEDQLAPSQMTQPMPAAVPEPTGPDHRAGTPAPRRAQADPPAAPAAPAATPVKPTRPTPGRLVVACSGPFAPDSGMLALALAYDSRNLIYTQVDVAGTKVGATIIFPKDPKRRLEVWWSNPNRTGTYLILINGQSTWTGPGGLRLHLTLAEVEKLNHKPFKLKGFDKDGNATASDWDGGALATLPGGCKTSASLRADPKAPADAVGGLPADHEYSSDDPALRAVKPTTSEILIGY